MKNEKLREKTRFGTKNTILRDKNAIFDEKKEKKEVVLGPQGLG